MVWGYGWVIIIIIVMPTSTKPQVGKLDQAIITMQRLTRHVSVIVMPNRRRSWVLWSMVWLRLWLGLRGRCSRGEEHMSNIRRISLDRAPVTSKPILRVPRCVDGRHRTRSTDRPTVHTNHHLRTATRRVTATRSTLIHLHARAAHPAARPTID